MKIPHRALGQRETWDHNELSVSCDEPGHTKFPFSYRAHVTSLTPAQGRLRIGSVLLTL